MYYIVYPSWLHQVGATLCTSASKSHLFHSINEFQFISTTLCEFLPAGLFYLLKPIAIHLTSTRIGFKVASASGGQFQFPGLEYVYRTRGHRNWRPELPEDDDTRHFRRCQM